MPRLAHLSDVHFGKIAHPGVVDALVADVNAAGVALVVVSGDLTQRARPREYADARALLARFDAPVLVVPGNHDVRAWWHNPVERVLAPTERFRREICPERTPTFTAPGLSVFGLDSAHGLTVKGGLIRPNDLGTMEAFFASRPPADLRVLVLHHHLLRLQALGEHDVTRRASLALDACARAGVDLVLCGHLHRSHVAAVEAPPGHTIVVATAGTATSSRGRGDNAGVNLYNWIVADEPTRFTVHERRFDAAAGAFGPNRDVTFERTDVAVAWSTSNRLAALP